MRLTFSELFAFCDLHASRAAQWALSGRLRYFDRQGFPIPGTPGDPVGTLEWARRIEDDDYVIVARDELPDGSLLSTVWLGLDHRWIGPPVFFETARFHDTDDGREYREFPDIFADEPDATTERLRYGTEEEALAAHHEILRRLRIREGH